MFYIGLIFDKIKIKKYDFTGEIQWRKTITLKIIFLPYLKLILLF